MTIQRVSTGYLLGVLQGLNARRPKRYLMEAFFPREQTFLTEEVYFEKILGNRRMAPFVSPFVKGKAMPTGGEAIVSYKPPYLKPKHALTATSSLVQLPGESILGDLTPAQRIQKARETRLLEQDDQIVRREEWMASQLLRTGMLTVTAEDHPPMVINLNRPAGQTVQLTGAARWGQAGVSPFANIQAWGQVVADASGAVPNTVIMDPKAASLLLQDATILKLLTNYVNYKPAGATLNITGQVALPDEAQYLGSFGGYDFIQYQQTYWNADGTVAKFMPDYTVIMGNTSGAGGVRCYGAIQDLKAGLVATSRFPKEWEEDDPSVLWLMTQSAPLPVMGLPEATFCATVN